MSAQNTIREEDYAQAVTLLQRHHLLRHAAGKDTKLDEDTADFFATACTHPTHSLGVPHPSDGLPDAVCHDCGVNTESDDPATVAAHLLPCRPKE